MKKRYSILLSLLAGLLLFSSCNDEWTEEQYERYISFKAPLNEQGVTRIYVRYTEDSISTYRLPVVVSGSTTNDQDMTVHVAIDPDTLARLNIEQYQSRTELYYEELTNEYFSMPETVEVRAGENTSLLNIDFSLNDIDLVDKWLLPLTVTDDPSYDYVAHPRKHYKKALLRVMPFNDYSGIYSGTALKTYLKGYEDDAAIVKSEVPVYVVDENTVFFYAGTVDEDRTDRRNYKINAIFNEQTKQVTLTADNSDIEFQVFGTPVFSVEETMDATRPYLLHRYVTISNIDYSFTDYTSVPNANISYTVRGSLILERKINTQIPDEDQAIEW
ncbi:DUF4973 domain-containing protein [uncultured Sunxiuqinia sp.]|uniref:DUF4973 domain-containing protein n=1 Tax=uncultured Sunxiuqinia sp. TaxID=1573825 RepID=UPI002AA615B7|nr:DUF4973 domain-containing protein [uncultured Sunxiuqinia sp.]